VLQCGVVCCSVLQRMSCTSSITYRASTADKDRGAFVENVHVCERVSLSVGLFVCLSVYLLARLSACLSICARVRRYAFDLMYIYRYDIYIHMHMYIHIYVCRIDIYRYDIYIHMYMYIPNKCVV